MKKEIFSFHGKVAFLLFIFLLLIPQFSFSQCTNPIPSGNSSQSFCKSDNKKVSDLVASGGDIVWYDTLTGGNQYNDNTLLIKGHSYFAEDVTGGNCSPRLEVIVSIYGDTPTNVAVFVGKCASEKSIISDLSADGSNIEWYDSQTGGTMLSGSDLLANNTTYWVQQTENGCTSVRIPTTVNLIDPPSPTVEPTQLFCSSPVPTVGDLQATEANVVWYDSETSTAPLSTSTLLVEGEDYWAVQTSFPCESTKRVSTIVTILKPQPPVITESTQTFCESQNATVADLMPNDANIVWYDNNGNVLASDTSLEDGKTYEAAQTEVFGTITCESVLRNNVKVTIIKPQPPVITEATQTFCELQNATVADLMPNDANIVWYDNNGNVLASDTSLEDGKIYEAAQAEVSGTITCESVLRNNVTVTISKPQPPIISNITQTFCQANYPTVANLQASGDTILWFESETATTPLLATDLLINNGEYWALNTDTSTSCESLSRKMVTAIITDVLPPFIQKTTQFFCSSGGATVGNLDTDSTVEWYISQVATTPLKTSDLLIDGQAYWAAAVDSNVGCVSSIRVSVKVSLNDSGTPTLTPKGNQFCIINNPTLENLNANVSASSNGNITWYDTYPNGSVLGLSESLIDGKTYFAIETDSHNCSSINPLEVTVDLYACDKFDVVFYDGFSPTGDGINDTFVIKNLRILYPDFKVEFFNRWGNKVYTSDKNKPDWNGRLNGNQDLLPTGVYYYVIHFNRDNRKSIQQRLYLSR